ncbi:MAG: hypothetical protein HY651_04775 [Acidobacteria bacterium]|nr:hypothetical protein [Acidobacteriota bacterium]
MKRFFLIVPLVLSFRLGLLAQATPTELRIHPVDESGNPVRISRAEIYLDLWGEGEKVSVPVEEAGVRVSLDRAWLCDARPASCEDPFVEGRLILRAEGYAPVVSRAFLWMEGVETPGDSPQSSVDVRFLSGAWMHLERGESKELTVSFRRPAERRLRFVDQTGGPVAGVGVRASLYLASSNHCGGSEGEEILEATSGPDGEITIPDADAEYAFELTKAHHMLINPQAPDYPMRASAVLSQPLSVVLLRQLEKHPLHLQIAGSGDLSGLALSACVAACPCGACCAQIGTSDSTGRISIEDFYPEEFERLTLVDRQGRPLWQSSPRPLDGDPVVIQLPAAPLVLSEPVPLERPR